MQQPYPLCRNSWKELRLIWFCLMSFPFPSPSVQRARQCLWRKEGRGLGRGNRATINKFQSTGNSPEVRWSGLCTVTAQGMGLILFGELRSPKLFIVAKKKSKAKPKEKEYFAQFHSLSYHRSLCPQPWPDCLCPDFSGLLGTPGGTPLVQVSEVTPTQFGLSCPNKGPQPVCPQ